MRPKLVVLSLVILAIALPFLIFENDARQIYCSGDYCDLRWNNGLVFSYPHGDSAFIISSGKFIPEDQVPTNTPFRRAWQGIYSRWDFPLVTVILLGVAMPVVLLIAAILLVLKTRSKRRL
jgi:hypothetical protein